MNIQTPGVHNISKPEMKKSYDTLWGIVRQQ